MYDSAQVAGLLWDRWLAESTKTRLDRAAGDPGGRRVLMWLAGAHDIGKISPAFQIKDMSLASRSGLPLCPDGADARRWHHTLAGGAAVVTLLQQTRWRRHRHWIADVVRGHHGVFPDATRFEMRNVGGDWPDPDMGVQRSVRAVHGGTEWEEARREALTLLTTSLDIAGSLEDLPEIHRPSPCEVVILTGLVIMADWIASNGSVMPGMWGAEAPVRAATSAHRAQAAWDKLRLYRGWDATLAPAEHRDVYTQRFGHTGWPARDVQSVTQSVAQTMPGPGLIIVEAPMGEGKTEAALVATEILASRFGLDGFFIGLPTQATSDAMFDRVTDWLGMHWNGSPLALAHGKKIVNTTLQSLPRWSSTGVGVDCEHQVMAPSEWFEGRKRTLLSPYVVGTIDNLLLAGAKVRHLPLYHAALAGKVVVLDEVHAADVYMTQFLLAALSWLGAAGVPVVLLSATLPAPQRRALLNAYSGVEPPVGPDDTAYPCITASTVGYEVLVRPAAASRPPTVVDLRVLHEPGAAEGSKGTGDAVVVGVLADLLSDGGCALVIRNTVGRAQSTFEALRRHFADGCEIELLHARFTAGHRARRTDAALHKLGPSERATRPYRYIMVATQVAEQSLDIDADVLVTDLCPIDLLLQRIGREHRHAGNDSSRPAKLRTPITYVTRMSSEPDISQTLPTSDHWRGFVYPLALLARTAQLVHRIDGATITLPDDIPALVAEVYQPDSGADRTDWAERLADYDRQLAAVNDVSSAHGENLAIVRAPECSEVAGLNAAAASIDGETEMVMVREGDIAVEAVLLERTADGRYRTLGADTDIVFDEDAEISKRDLPSIAASTIRIPPSILTAPILALGPLPGWRTNPWLSHAHALILDEDGRNRDLTVTRTTGGVPRTVSLDVTYQADVGLSWSARRERD